MYKNMDTHTMVTIIIENKPPLYVLSIKPVTKSLTIFLVLSTLWSIILFKPNIFIVFSATFTGVGYEPQRVIVSQRLLAQNCVGTIYFSNSSVPTTSTFLMAVIKTCNRGTLYIPDDGYQS